MVLAWVWSRHYMLFNVSSLLPPHSTVAEWLLPWNPLQPSLKCFLWPYCTNLATSSLAQSCITLSLTQDCPHSAFPHLLPHYQLPQLSSLRAPSLELPLPNFELPPSELPHTLLTQSCLTTWILWAFLPLRIDWIAVLAVLHVCCPAPDRWPSYANRFCYPP